MNFRILRAIIGFFSLLPICMTAQEPASTAGLSKRPTAKALFLNEDPKIDGEVLGDAVWQTVKPFGELHQAQPNFGMPATEKTEIRVAYTSQTFYVSVVCYDAQPNKLVVSDARRNADLDNTDAFLFILDTYKNGQNGFIFGTNSFEVEYDAQVDNEGQGNFNANR